MQPLYLQKNLTAASSNGIGSISTAATPVITLNSSQLDTGRRIVFYSSGDASSLYLQYTGTTEDRGGLLTDRVYGSTAAGIAATTTSDFTSITAVSYSSAPNIPIIIGTSSMGGTPWKLANWHINPMILGGAITFTTSANGLTGQIDITYDDPTATYADPDLHGAYVPCVFNSTSPIGVQASANSHGTVNVDANTIQPFVAWRLTATSSSSAAGTVWASVIQAGIG